ncbi:TPR repeat-containing protein PA4667 [Cupriavidus necator N-1]|uniref:TPR repeat-containing protein PA4667 n=2 Tax=Pseudomonadota TaxID=1224 RepID=G0EUP7_CUPNN|nr:MULTISPECIES: tetratricopeptide repeat protein [Cupriavidus]AEI75758.1 TPR repeat-containing protein PA4667 [Cupriavidus necator N-1]KAI3599783.1 TPR domain protein [Cupriavidus necator H850]MDX6012102.1 tetratricopeptide repeat protein [Cupriavidus necator]QUN28812.1 tetratricopeptide repeat protein [Cupriavidus sp. KK10]
MSDLMPDLMPDSTLQATAGGLPIAFPGAVPRTARTAGALARFFQAPRRHARALAASALLALAAGASHAAPPAGAMPLPSALQLAAAESERPAAASKPARSALPSLELTDDIVYMVLAAEISMQRGLVGPAYRTYMELARQTRDPRFAQRATEIAFNARIPQQALDSARLWKEISPTSPAANQVLSTLLVLNGRWDDARPLLQQQLAAVPATHRGEAILQLQQQLSRTSDPAGAATLLQDLTKNDTKLPETQLALARAREVAGDEPGALAALDQALRLRPDYEAAALMAAELRAEKQPDEAVAILKRFLDKSPDSVNGHITLARLYLLRNDMQSARQEFETLRKVAPGDPRVPLALGLTSLQAKNYGEAEQYLKEYLQLVEKQPTANPDIAYQYLAQIAEERKDYAGAIQWLDRIEDIRLAPAATAKRAQLLARMGKLDDAQALFGEMLTDAEDIPDPGQRTQRVTAIRQAEVATLMESKAYDRARKLLNDRVTAEPDNADWIYELAMLDERQKRYDSMEKGLRKVIALQPQQKQGYNALGYSLADRNERLPEALKLLERASELGPDDPYIMDSLAWVKFRMGDLRPAADLLRNAYSKAPEAEIGAHLGEVLWQLGEHDEARKTWTEAVRTDPENETLVDTLRRYKVNMQLSK